MAPCGWNINIGCCTDWDTYDEAVQQTATALAVTTMWAATGRRFGLCEITVQPCHPAPAEPLYMTYPASSAPGYRDRFGLTAGPLTDGCGGGCRCTATCQTRLDGPAEEVVTITVAGEVVDPAAYQIHDRHLLVRVDGECWPSCVDYSTQDPAGFEVTYLRGEVVPEAAEAAAGILACEMARSCTGADCRLPPRLASLSRQGVEVQVAEAGGDWLDRMLTGIDEVDRVIVALNPHRMHGRPRVMSPDLPSPRYVTSIGSL